MRKKLLFLMIMCLFGGMNFLNLNAQEVTVGESTSNINYLPLRASNKMSLTQQIYTSDDLQGYSGTITSLSFYKASGNQCTRNIEIYLINTDKASFSSKTDWVDGLSASAKVYDASTVSPGTAGWVNFEITPFEYTGGNLLVCLYDKTNGYGSTATWGAFTGSTNISIDKHTDTGSTVLDPQQNVTTSATDMTNKKNVIKFTFASATSLAEPTKLAATPAQCYMGENVALSWTAAEGANGYNVYVGGIKHNDTPVTVTTYTISDLAYSPTTGHSITVKAIHGDQESAASDPVYVYVSAKLDVTGYVYLKNTTDGIEGASVTLTMNGADELDNTVEPVTLTTDATGKFTATALPVAKYDIQVAKTGYYGAESTVTLVYGSTTTPTIYMEAYPEAEDVDVMAINAGDVANVLWTAEKAYSSYKVYRQNVETEDIKLLASGITEKEYQDNGWASLEGSYRYGVSAVGMVSNHTEGFEGGNGVMPEDWTTYGTHAHFPWTVKNSYTPWNSGISYGVYAGAGAAFISSGSGAYGYNSSYYLVFPKLDLTTVTSPTIAFNYLNPPMYGSYYGWDSDLYTQLELCVSTVSAEGEWITLKTYGTTGTDSNAWANDIVSLEEYAGQEIYVAFKVSPTYGYYSDYGDYYYCWSDCTVIDNVTFPMTESGESQIVWSDPIDKSMLSIVFEGEGNWNEASNWNTNEVPADGEDVTINGAAVITDSRNVKNLVIMGSGSLTLGNESVLTVNGQMINKDASKFIINDGAQLVQNSEDVKATYNMTIAPYLFDEDVLSQTGWQFIGSPFTDYSIKDDFIVFVVGEGDDYDLYRYDGSADSLEWLNYENSNHAAIFDKFEPGVGYLYSNKNTESIPMTGTLNASNTFAKNDFVYDAEKPVANFYLLSNPFTFDMDWNKVGLTNIVDGYAFVKADGAYDYKYRADNEPVKVGDGFFVKVFDENASMSYPNASKSSAERVESLSLVATGAAGSDNVVITFAGSDKEGFDKLQNFNEKIANIYVMNNGTRYGIGNFDRDVTEVEVAFEAKEMGNYTIAAQPNGKFSEVILVDRMTGIETNLLMEGYEFTSTSRDNYDRFVVKFAMAENAAEEAFAYQSGEELVVNAEGMLQIVDVMGRVVYSGEVSGDSRINVSGMNNAAYIVRVVSENGVKTQKVVIF